MHRGLWNDELRGHACDCRDCGEATAAALFMQQIDRASQAGVSLPGAGQMWWKAQMRARREAIERAARPISFVQSAALLLAALSFAGACVWQSDSLLSWISYLVELWHIPPGAIGDLAMNLWKSWSFTLVAGGGAVAVFVTFVVGLACSKD